MPRTATIQARIDPKIKAQAQEILNKPIKTTITQLQKAIKTINNEIPEVPESINTISNFYLLGETPDALDYFELLVRAVAKLTQDEFSKFIENLGKTDYCNNSYDLNIFIGYPDCFKKENVVYVNTDPNLEEYIENKFIVIDTETAKAEIIDFDKKILNYTKLETVQLSNVLK